MTEEKIIFRREEKIYTGLGFELYDIIEIHDKGDHIEIGINDDEPFNERWGWQSLSRDDVWDLYKALKKWLDIPVVTGLVWHDEDGELSL